MGKIIGRIALLYTALACILLWPLPLHLGNTVIDAGDPLFYAWNLSHNWQSALNGFSGLLDTNIYYPTTNTLAFSDTLFVQTLLLSPILAITGNPILVQNVYTILTFVVAGLGTYLLVFSLTKHQHASVLGGLFYAFSIPRLGQITHIPALSSQWMPFLILYTLRFFDYRKSQDAWIAAGFFLASSISSVYFFVFSIFTVSIIGAVVLLTKPQSRSPALIKRAIPPLIVLGVMLAVTNYPYLRLAAENPGLGRSLDEAAVFAAYQKDYWSVPEGSIWRRLLPTAGSERTLYPTLTVLALSFLALIQSKVKKKSRNDSIVFSVLGLTGLILSLGPTRPFSIGFLSTPYIPLPYGFLYKVLPILKMIRVPARFSILVSLSLAVLSAIGIAKTKKLAGSLVLHVGLAALFLFEVWQYPLTLISIPSIPSVYTTLASRTTEPIVELPIGNIESGVTPISLQVKKNYTQITQDDPLVAETFRVYFSGIHGMTTANGYSGFVPTSFHETIDALSDFPSLSSIEFLHKRRIRYVIIHLWQYHPWQARILEENLAASNTLNLVYEDRGDAVYEIIP